MTSSKPVRISFQGVDHSDAVEQRIREQVAKLDRYFDGIMGTHVTVESPHHHQHRGHLYHIHIEVEVPRTKLVVSNDRHDRPGHEDVYIAIRDAFKAAQRQVHDYAEKLKVEPRREVL